MITVAVTAHNMEWMLGGVLEAILRHTANTFELIVMLDGCTDQSEARARTMLRMPVGDYRVYPLDAETARAAPFLRSTGLQRLHSARLIKLPNVFEVRSSNAAMISANPESSHCLLVQDDMIVNEPGWDQRLLAPLMAFDDVFMVTARNAFNMRPPPGCNIVSMVGRNENGTPSGELWDSGQSLEEVRKRFYVRDTVNRGPIAVDLGKMSELGYFDEAFYPQMWDDADICYRAKAMGWVCGFYHVEYMSDECWGSTRTKATNTDYKQLMHRAWKDNFKRVCDRHASLMSDRTHDERLCVTPTVP